MNPKKRKKTVYVHLILAISLATLVFLAGIFLGGALNERKLSFLITTNQDLQARSGSMQVMNMLYEEFPCEVFKSNILSSELDRLGDRLTHLERQFGKNNPNILRLKNEYMQILIQHWIQTSRANDVCDLNIDIIVYFYSNTDCDICVDQGRILSALKNKLQDAVFIYAIDVNSNESAVRTLLSIHEVYQVPSLLINDVLYEGFFTLSDIESILIN